MSLINQMLKDLERRQKAGSRLDGHVLAGVGSVDGALPRPVRRRWRVVAPLVGLLGAVLYGGGPQFAGLVQHVTVWRTAPAQLLPRAPAAHASRVAAAGPSPRTSGTARRSEGANPPGRAARMGALAGPTPRTLPGPRVTESAHAPPVTAEALGTPETAPGSAARPARVRTQGLPESVRTNLPAPSKDLGSAFAAAPAVADGKQEAQDLPAPEGRMTKTPVRYDARTRAEMLYSRGRTLMETGEAVRGEELWHEALAVYPAYVPAREALIMRRLGQGRLSEAVVLLQEGLRATPTYYPFAKTYARILVDQDRIEDAAHVLEAHAPAVSEDPEYHAFRAALLQRQGEHALAVAVYRDVLRLRPHAGVWWMGLGISLEALGQRRQALDAYRRAHESGVLGGAVQRFVERKLAELGTS